MKTIISKTARPLTYQKKPLKSPAKNSKTTTQQPISVFSRLYFALIAGLIGTGIGGLFDIFLSFARALFHPQTSGDFIWFLTYILGGTGILVGLCFGSRSGEFFAQLFNMSDDTESSASEELIRIIAKALFIAILAWSVFAIFI